MGIENGIIYRFRGEDGTEAVVGPGAEADPAFVGYLNAEDGVTGLDSAALKEATDQIVGGHGRLLSRQFMDGLSPGFAGIVNPGLIEPGVRNVAIERLRRATTALNGYGVVRWTNSDETIERALWWRTQNALKIAGRLPKTWQAAMMCEEWRHLSWLPIDGRAGNLLTDPSFQAAASGQPVANYSAWVPIGSGTTLYSNAQALDSNQSVAVTNTFAGAPTDRGIQQFVRFPESLESMADAGLYLVASASVQQGAAYTGRSYGARIKWWGYQAVGTSFALSQIATTVATVNSSITGTGWTRLSAASQVPQVDAQIVGAMVEFYEGTAGAVSGDLAYWDAAQVEVSAVPTPSAFNRGGAVVASSGAGPSVNVYNAGNEYAPWLAIVTGPTPTYWYLAVNAAGFAFAPGLYFNQPLAANDVRYIYLWPPRPGIAVVKPGEVSQDSLVNVPASSDVYDLQLPPGASTVSLSSEIMSPGAFVAGQSSLAVVSRHAWMI